MEMPAEFETANDDDDFPSPLPPCTTVQAIALVLTTNR